MSSSYSSTSTYTSTDIENVVRKITTDLVMIAQSTKAITTDKVKSYGHDIEILLKNSYLKQVDITLLDSRDNEICATQYKFITENARGTEIPGNVLWPLTPNGNIRIILSYTDLYFSEKEKAANLNLANQWVATSASTEHTQLSKAGSREYSSNGFGTKRNDYS